MDPWSAVTSEKEQGSLVSKELATFEDDFKPAVCDTLPDSKQYLEILESKLNKIKNDPDVLKQLSEKREACMQQLLNGEVEYNDDILALETPLNQSAILRAVAPERQALTSGEIVELINYDLLNEEDDNHSDTASR